MLSLPVSTLVSGIDSEQVLDQNLAIVRNFKPFSAGELEAIEAKYRPVATDGRYEMFKSTTMFDGPVHKQQHGFELV